jgi:hypothetical protein
MQVRGPLSVASALEVPL